MKYLGQMAWNLLRAKSRQSENAHPSEQKDVVRFLGMALAKFIPNLSQPILEVIQQF